VQSHSIYVAIVCPDEPQTIVSIEALHHDAGLPRALGVDRGRDMAGLPDPVHFVAQAPQRHVVRRGVPVPPAPVGPGRPARQVAVLDELRRLVGPAGPEIDRQQRARPERRAPIDELVEAELVGLDGPPRVIGSHRTLVLRADTVPPVAEAHEVAARVAHDGHAERAQRLQHIAAEAALVAQGITGVVDTLVDGAAHVLEEPPEDAPVDRADVVFRVEMD